VLALIPNLMISKTRMVSSERSTFAPLAYMKANPGGLTRLIAPMLVTSIGAGMIMPFMNLYFRNVHNQSDAAIGVMFAWGSLAMAIGLLIAPVLAEKFGKIEIVVLSQALSIPFLVMLGFAPIFSISLVAYYVRIMLMNMSGPVYSTFVMEQVDGKYRAMVASLSSMAHQFGWAFSPTISGYLQVRYGFKPAFMVTIFFYLIAIIMYYLWFWKNRRLPFQPGSPTKTLVTVDEGTA
jgi:MFS family permease